MPIDKSWIDMPNRVSEEFTNALDSFVESCRPLVDSDGNIKCPCRRCANRYSVNLIVMRRHIVTFGFFKRYIRWIYHGEAMVPRVVENDALQANSMGVVIQDVMGERMDEDTSLNRKSYARKKFNLMSRHIDEIKKIPPKGMPQPKWNELIDFWQTNEFQRSSRANKANRALQTVQNRGGSSSCARTAFKTDCDRVLAYRRHHANHDGVFHNPIEKKYYHQLLQGLSNTMNASQGNHIDQRELTTIFEDVFGPCRGHLRGLGPKPTLGAGGRRGSSSKGKGIASDYPLNYSTAEGMQAMFMDRNFQQYMQQCYGLPPPTIPPEWQQNPGGGSVNPSVDHTRDDIYDEEFDEDDLT